MIAPGYRLIAELSREPSAVLYRAERHRDRARVLVKAATPGVHGPFAAAALRREHALIAALDGPGVPRVLALDESESGTVLVLEDPGGVLLATRLADGPMPVAAALTVGRSLASTLGALHREGVVDKHVNPYTVLADTTGASAP